MSWRTGAEAKKVEELLSGRRMNRPMRKSFRLVSLELIQEQPQILDSPPPG
jgi:hypothetical protein